MVRRRLSAAAAVLALAGTAAAGWGLGAARAAAVLVDQRQPLVDTQAPGLALGGASAQQLAQTVRAGVSGPLREVQLPVSCVSGDGTVTVQVQGLAGSVPAGPVLAGSRVAADQLRPYPSRFSFRSFAFAPAARFQAGDRFALVLGASGACELAASPEGDTYPAGDGLFRDADLPQDAWQLLGRRADLPFRTLVEAQAGEETDEEHSYVVVRCFVTALTRP